MPNRISRDARNSTQKPEALLKETASTKNLQYLR